MKTGGLAAGAAIAAISLLLSVPSDAQEKKVRLNMAGAYPSSTAILGTGQLYFADKVKKISGGSIDIRFFEPGALVPANQYFDAIAGGSLEAAYSGLGFFTGKDSAFALFSTVPFGPEIGEYLGWMRYGGGEKLMQELSRKYNMEVLLCGTIAPEASGWFRKEIKTVDDLKGLKMRTSGFAGEVLSKLGVVPQQIAGGDIYPALEKGTIDAAEWVGPYDDQKLGFNKVAPNYYYPGWWEAGPQLSAYVNLAKWNELPKSYQALIEAAAAKAHTAMLSKYDTQNPKALRELVASGTKLLAFTPQVLEACYAATNQVYDETMAKNPRFKKIYETWKPFRAEEVLWFRVVENTLDNFMARLSASNKL